MINYYVIHGYYTSQDPARYSGYWAETIYGYDKFCTAILNSSGDDYYIDVPLGYVHRWSKTEDDVFQFIDDHGCYIYMSKSKGRALQVFNEHKEINWQIPV